MVAAYWSEIFATDLEESLERLILDELDAIARRVSRRCRRRNRLPLRIRSVSRREARGIWRVGEKSPICCLPKGGDLRKRSIRLFSASLAASDCELLIERLRANAVTFRELPAPQFTDSQWQAVQAAVSVLTLAVAELQLVFRERGRVDFAELAIRASAALGQVDAPEDLALALGHRIQHFLVDEFQDTSYTQFELIEKLTAGWEPGDGRTLFLVGDPMQSDLSFSPGRREPVSESAAGRHRRDPAGAADAQRELSFAAWNCGVDQPDV